MRGGFAAWSVLSAILAVLGAILLWQGVVGRMEPTGDFIALGSPLQRDAGYCALSAGSSVALNLHYIESGSTAASFEKHSIDFIRKNDLGFRAVAGNSLNPKPADLADYAIYGATVVAPCSGEVIEAVNDRPDQPAGHDHRSRDGANIVTLKCESREVLLAHFQQGSVRVEVGDMVSLGDPLGRVGNSGNTEEPHLHIHTQERQRDGTLRPVPMRIDGRYLARGDCL